MSEAEQKHLISIRRIPTITKCDEFEKKARLEINWVKSRLQAVFAMSDGAIYACYEPFPNCGNDGETATREVQNAYWGMLCSALFEIVKMQVSKPDLHLVPLTQEMINERS
jgi:hypothetical protein